MYHHHQQGPQPFPNGARPPPNQQQGRASAEMMPPVAGFQFPRPTQLPDELESALSIRGSRDMDHRLIEHLDRLKQASASGIGQHGNYSTNLCESQPNQQQGVDWSSYEPPTKLFGSPSAAHQGQHQAGHAGTSITNWNNNESATLNPRADGGRGLYTPESAGTILASFGLSNEDLEALSHFPDDQLTPDTLPFILRDMQIHKSGKPKTTSHSSPMARSQSPEVPSRLAVIQTERRVIDYGHASQAKDDSGPQKIFKKEQLSSERTVKMYPTSSASKLPSGERRQVRLEPSESVKHGDRDYRRRSSELQSSRSPPAREFSAPSKSRHQDRDYRHERPKPRASAEKRHEESSLSKQHAFSGSKPHSDSSSRKLPTPTMISDFSGLPPKVYPHTCSLCDMQCDQEKDWIQHLETVNHTAACRDLRSKYPHWRPNPTSRNQYGKQSEERKRRSPLHSTSRSVSWSPSPPPGKHRPASYRPGGKPYAPYHLQRHQQYRDFDARFARPQSRDGSHLHRPSFRQIWDKRDSSEGSTRPFLKRPYDSMRRVTGSKGGPAIKRPTQTKTKPGMKPGNGTTKQVSPQQSDEAPPAKKKKKPAALQVGPGPDCLVYLTDIPKDATEQEVINLAGSFGPINNVLLLPGSDEEEENGLQASVCMIKPEDAQAFVNSPTRLIRDHVITASVAKKPDDEKPDDANSATKSEQSNDPEQEGDQISEKKGVVMIEGLPESGWSEDDLIKMAEPFGFPSDIILAKQIGKALLLLPDVETAVEMVKVHTFNPATINEHKLKMSRVKKIVSIANPVALYNLLIEPTEGVKNVKPVGWSMLVVVSNIPEVPSSASVVQKLVSRIGTVLRSLVVNDMVICEMATGLLAAAVYKHYTRFPCIIQNNPLIFSRKPDLKAQTKVSNPDAGKDTPENKKDAPTQANQEESVVKEDSTEEEKIKDVEMKSEKPEEEVVGENTSKETSDEAKDDVKTDPNTEADNEMETTETTETVETETETVETETVETEKVKTETKTPDDVEMEPVEENKRNNASPAENDDKTPAGDETKTPAAGEATSEEKTVKAEAPKVVSTDAQKAQTKPAESKQRQTSMEKTKDPAKDKREEERRRPERERKERETREREKREQEKREREKIRKEREREDRAKKERERRGDWRRDESRRERERRERDRKELERRDRKRPYGDRERRSSSERNRRGHWREDRWKSSSERSMVDEEQVDFPFNLSDFVTVDEVGDVDPADIPDVPLADMETTKTGKDPSEPSQQQPEVSLETSTKPGKEVPAVKDEAEAQEKTPTDKEPASSSAAEDRKAVDEAVDEAADVSDLTNLPPEAVPVVTNEKDQDDPTPPQQDTSEDQDDPTPPQQDTSEVSATATGNEEEEEEMMEVKDEAQEETQEKAEAQNEGKDGAQNEGKDGAQNEGKDGAQNEGKDEAQNEGKDEAQNEGKDEAQNEGKEEQKILADIKSSRPAAENEKSENTEKDDITENSPDQSEVSSDYSLPPFDPSNPVGMEYLVPMTGFFCKVCTRFFTGTKDTEISHSKTLKHYENLEKFLNARKTSPASSVKGGST